MSKTVLTDLALVRGYDADIGELYQQAKNLYLDAPIQTLVELRNITEIICRQVVSEYGLAPENHTLNAAIKAINSARIFSPLIIGLLKGLRDAGNKAAHKHSYHFSYEQYSTLALETLREFCELIDALKNTTSSAVAPYSFDENVDSRFQALSYQVLFEEDPAAKFTVGIALVDKYCQQFKTDNHFALIDQQCLHRGLTLLEEAAKARHVDAMYEYGYMLANGHGRDQDMVTGTGYLHGAAAAGHNRAKAYFALYTLQESEVSQEDADYAMDFLKTSASAGDPLGQYILADQYLCGKFITQDHEQALAWLDKSAQAGYCGAYYALGRYYAQQDLPGNVEQVVGLMVKAVELGHIEANLFLARLGREHPPGQEAVEGNIQWYEKYLAIKPDLAVYLELAQYLYAHSANNIERLEKALLFLVQICHRTQDHRQIRREVDKLSRLWLKTYAQVIQSTGMSEQTMNISLQFKPDGTPHRDEHQMAENLQAIFNDPSLLVKLTYTPNTKEPRLTHGVNAKSRKTKVGRNAPCPCQSGQKYKQCCG